MYNKHPYGAHARFARPAIAKSAPLLVLTVIFVFEIIFGVVGALTYTVLPQDQAFPDSTAFGTVLVFASFGVTLLLFHGLVRVVHKRGVGSMLGPIPQVWRDGRRALVAVGGLLLSLEVLMPSYNTSDIEQTRNIFAWAAMLPFGIAAITVQCATEEVIYRGYLQQQVAVLTKGPWPFLLVPSIAFGASHYWNGWGPSDGVLYALWATMLGLACADLTARSGSLGAAIGLHTAKNLFAALFFAELDGPSSGLALFLVEPTDWWAFDYSLDQLKTVDAGLDVFFSGLIVWMMWMAARIAIRR